MLSFLLANVDPLGNLSDLDATIGLGIGAAGVAASVAGEMSSKSARTSSLLEKASLFRDELESQRSAVRDVERRIDDINEEINALDGVAGTSHGVDLESLDRHRGHLIERLNESVILREDLIERRSRAELVWRDCEVAINKSRRESLAALVVAIGSYFVMLAGIAFVLVGGMAVGVVTAMIGVAIRVQAALFDRRAKESAADVENKMEALRAESDRDRQASRALRVVDKMNAGERKDEVLANIAMAMMAGNPKPSARKAIAPRKKRTPKA